MNTATREFRTLTDWLDAQPADAVIRYAAGGLSPTDDLPVVFDGFTDPASTDFATGLRVYIEGENFDPCFPEDLGLTGIEAGDWTPDEVTAAIAYWVSEHTNRTDLTFTFDPTFPAAVALNTWATTSIEGCDGHVLAA